MTHHAGAVMVALPLGCRSGATPAGGSILVHVSTVARYEHLPIYKKAMDLAVYFEKVVRNFSRYHKYTLGSELRAKSWDLEGGEGLQQF